MKPVNLKSEDGSVLLFGLGLSIAALMITTVAINVAAIWTTRNVLDGIADGAALAAAQAIDADAVYQDGIGTRLRISESAARVRVRDYVRAANTDAQVQQFSIRAVMVSGTSVTVTVQAKPKLAFGYLMPVSSPVVVSSAKAINKVR
jgi:hypothetical protein